MSTDRKLITIVEFTTLVSCLSLLLRDALPLAAAVAAAAVAAVAAAAVAGDARCRGASEASWGADSAAS